MVKVAKADTAVPRVALVKGDATAETRVPHVVDVAAPVALKAAAEAHPDNVSVIL
ncbi:hypothetical protein D3C86_2215890 [compost metagenome]